MYVNDILKNKNSLHSIYDYFKNKVEDVPETFSDNIEQYFSKFQLDMCDQNQPYHEAFLEYLLEAYLYSKDNTGAIDEDRFFQQVVDPNALECDEDYTRLRSVRASFALQKSEDHDVRAVLGLSKEPLRALGQRPISRSWTARHGGPGLCGRLCTGAPTRLHGGYTCSYERATDGSWSSSEYECDRYAKVSEFVLLG